MHLFELVSADLSVLCDYLTRLFSECRYVAVDLPGHGLSSHRPPGESYSLFSFTADVHRVADALQLRTFSIISHSMGSDVAGMFSALYPEMVDALVLLDSYGFLPTDSKEIPEVMRRGIDEQLKIEKISEENKRVYTYEKAVERMSAANPSMSEQSVHILLERGLVQVEGGFVFSRDLRVNVKHIMRTSLDQCLEMQSRIQAPVIVVLAEDGYNRIFPDIAQEKYAPILLQSLLDRNHKVLTVPGDHHVHLNKPEVVAPFVSDFLQSKVLNQGKHKL
ncbi:serine hydrolase-like protein isoform X4 [Centropristis striata]|uniref:serine hydrolase-like protein isoform X4 n=1 Tax=Centropristis striata TaxID=184440 RepID=UPI0027DF64E6|nr:serine hydrolase-like protein isoform X4 [Centropristis striata]